MAEEATEAEARAAAKVATCIVGRSRHSQWPKGIVPRRHHTRP